MVRDRGNPFIEFTKDDFLDEFHLPKDTVLQQLQKLGNELDLAQPKATGRPTPPPIADASCAAISCNKFLPSY